MSTSFDWSAKGYREIINNHLGYRNQRRPRGAIKKLADHLRCHSTFIAQVLGGRADFSLEQGMEICRYFGLPADQQDYFLLLLLRDRAGTKQLVEYYEQKLKRALEARRDLKAVVSPKENLSEVYEAEYYGNWIYQAIHALVQIDRYRSVSALSKFLGRTADEVRAILSRLSAMGLVEQAGTSWRSTQAFLHLPKESPFIRSLHSTWKAKIQSDLQTQAVLEGTHYSGMITVTEKDYQKVRDVLVKAISEIRSIVTASESEEAYVLSFDCYKM